MSKKFTWTKEQMETAANLWNAGLTALAISKILGVSRNSVVGKVYRAGLQRGAGWVRPKKPYPLPKHIVPERPIPEPVFIKVSPTPVYTGAKTLRHLSPMECRYAVGTSKKTGAHTFCAKPLVSSKRGYCDEHYNVVWREPAKRVR